MYDEEKWFSASNASSMMGVAVYTQLAFKADSLRCGQWTMHVQNPVGKEEAERMSEWQTQAVLGEDRGHWPGE